MPKKKIFIFEGLRIGNLTVGDLVYNVQSHPLFLSTKQSYLQHGRLRECMCDCGQMVLYSENALQSKTLKSCGCLRNIQRLEAAKTRINNEERRIQRMEITHKIQVTQARLKLLQSTPEPLRNNLEIEQVAKQLRKLYAMKARVNRKA